MTIGNTHSMSPFYFNNEPIYWRTELSTVNRRCGLKKETNSKLFSYSPSESTSHCLLKQGASFRQCISAEIHIFHSTRQSFISLSPTSLCYLLPPLSPSPSDLHLPPHFYLPRHLHLPHSLYLPL